VPPPPPLEEESHDDMTVRMSEMAVEVA